MIIPIQCFTCGKQIGHLWEKYLEKLQEEYDGKENLKKAVILKTKTNSNIINKNKKTINNSSGLLSNKMLNRFESNGKAIIYSLKN